MYESFYNLTAAPFSLLPDADFLFLSKRHRRAKNVLDYGLVTRAGFVVMTGEVGTGKTTLLRRYIRNVESDVQLGIISNPTSASGRLLNWVCMAFEIECQPAEDEACLYHKFVDYLVEQYAAGKRAILIIDEAQNLNADRLEELRMLSNVNNEKDQLLQIVLVGQPELLDLLKQQNLRQFVQRISVHCHLEPLDAVETAYYVWHRLQTVEGDPDIFSPESCARIYYYTGGVPRLINLLCDQALVYGFSEDAETIEPFLIDEVVADRAQGGLSPFRLERDEKEIASILDEIQAVCER